MYKTYAFTIRPKCGIRDSDISHFINKFKKSKYYIYVVTEKEGTERHIHAQIWYDKPTPKGVVSKFLSREFPKLWSADEYILKVALDVRVVFNHDWMQQYCQKDEYTCWLNFKPEPQLLDSYLPPQEKQDEWIARKSATDTQLHDLEIKYKEKYDEVNIMNVAKFLAAAMFGEEKWIRPLRSKKAKVELANTFYFWLNKDDGECAESFIDTGSKSYSPNIDSFHLYYTKELKDKQEQILKQEKQLLEYNPTMYAYKKET